MLLQYNWLAPATKNFSVYLPQQPGNYLVRHNAIQSPDGISFAFRNGYENERHAGRYWIANNYLEVTHAPMVWGFPKDKLLGKSFTEQVCISNNIISSRLGYGILLNSKEIHRARDHWRVGPNAYVNHSGGINAEWPAFPRHPGDLIGPIRFLADDPKQADYLRLPADSPLATAGAGGDLPAYIGPFPPGPAPKGGDWWTRVREPGRGRDNAK